jgi:hypothetical protein
MARLTDFHRQQKGGSRAHVKGFTTFETNTNFRGLLVSSLSILSCIHSGILCSGIPSDFQTPQHWRPPWFQSKSNSRCLHRRSPRRTLLLRLTKKTITLEKKMKSLLPQNPHKSQIKKGGKSLRLFRRQELSK